MENGMPVRLGGPQFALMISPKEGEPGQVVYSDPREADVVSDAAYRNEQAKRKGRSAHYWVQRRDPVNIKI